MSYRGFQADLRAMPATPEGAPTAIVGGAPPALRRRARVRGARLLAPILLAGLIGLLLSGTPVSGLIIAVATLVCSLPLRGFPYPMRLMPASNFLLTVSGPLVGGGAVLSLVALGAAPSGLTGWEVVSASIAGAVAAFAAERIGRLVLRARPLRLAVLGSPRYAVGLRRELEETGLDDVELVGWLNAGGELIYPGDVGDAAVERVREAIVANEIDVVVRGRGRDAEHGGMRPFQRVAEACLDLPVRVIDGNQLYEDLFGHVPMGTIDSAWYLYLMHPRFRSTEPAAKRAVDVATAVLVGIVTLPLLALAALAVKLDDRGPVFYRQRRVGEGGREFEIVKLRTMRLDAEATGIQWSAAADDRVTRVGRALRRSHLDELPQIFNVLRGDMTLVGPRPERPEIVAQLEHAFTHYRRRQLVKPGVTGWAQVRCGYAGSTLGTAWKVCHDLYYLKHRSILADLLIMLETLVIAAKDAHRAMRAPASQFLYGEELGLELTLEERRELDRGRGSPEPRNLPVRV